MNTFIRYSGSIFAFLLGVFAAFYFKGCDKPVKPGTIIKTIRVIDTQYVNIRSTRYVKGDTIKIDTTIFIPIPEKVDTISILKQFYSQNVFIDTFKTDYGNLLITDTIALNKIKGRLYTSDLRVPIVTINDTIYVADKKIKPALFWGMGGYMGNGKVIGASTNLLLETGGRKLYGVGVGVVNGKPVYKVMAMIKL